MSNGRSNTRAGRGLAPSPAERAAAARSADAARYQGQVNSSNRNAILSRGVGSVLRPQTVNTTGPRPLATPSSSSSWERALSTGLGSQDAVKSKEKVSVKPPEYIPGGSESSFTTDPSNSPEPDPYPSVLPSLSAEQLGSLAERRRIADKRLKLAEEESRKRRELLEASANRNRATAERDSKRSMDDFMREVAGRGLARSPMIAGRETRRAGEDLRLAYGEIDTKLATEISALQDLVSQAELARSEEIASISQDEVNMRADLERLFPAANMYG